MAIVNNILNMVDLNTKKYSEKLKKMKKDTARDTKSMSEGFKGIVRHDGLLRIKNETLNCCLASSQLFSPRREKSCKRSAA